MRSASALSINGCIATYHQFTILGFVSKKNDGNTLETNTTSTKDEHVVVVSNSISKLTTNMSNRRIGKNGNQLKITNMFPVKRSRSDSDEVEEYALKKMKSDIVNKTEDGDKIKNDENEVKKNVQKSDIMINMEKETEAFKQSEDVSKCEDNVNLLDKEDNVLSSLNDKEKPIVNNGERKLLPIVSPDNEKCEICGQFLNNSDIIYYQGHPQNAVEEFIALTNEKLLLASGDDGDIMERPQTNITASVYLTNMVTFAQLTEALLKVM
ncbi:unnamed protein product, partial [Iphiclides podalirius]